MKSQVSNVFGVLVASAALLSAIQIGQAAETRPNVILFIADDMAWDDCGVYGHPHIRTPNVDDLARRGMRFDNAHLTCSSCSPSRCSIITGRYPHNTGAHQLHLPLPGDQTTFVELLKQSGYYTASAGKWHMGDAIVPRFDKVVTQINHWVETVQTRPKDKPFFFWFAFTDPHRGYQPGAIPVPHKLEDVIVPPYLPDVPEVRADLAMYYDEITRLDGVVGKVVDELERQQVTDSTMIIFISDNGRPFPRCKTTVYDSGVRTPWIVCWPGHVAAGSTTNSLVSAVDIAPTVLEMAGLPIGQTFQGVSFLPILKDPAAITRRYAFSEHNWHDFDDYGRSVRSDRFRYVRNYYTDIPGTPPADAVASPTYQAMLRLKEEGKLTADQLSCFTAPRPKEELFDLQNDPNELHNLAGQAEYADVQAKLSQTLDQWERDTSDTTPAARRPDEFDRITGQRLPEFQKKRKPKAKPKQK